MPIVLCRVFLPLKLIFFTSGVCWDAAWIFFPSYCSYLGVFGIFITYTVTLHRTQFTGVDPWFLEKGKREWTQWSDLETWKTSGRTVFSGKGGGHSIPCGSVPGWCYWLYISDNMAKSHAGSMAEFNYSRSLKYNSQSIYLRNMCISFLLFLMWY